MGFVFPFVFPDEGLSFLTDLTANNNKEWFAANKKRYERDLKQPARSLVEALNGTLVAISPRHVSETPHKTLNRINELIRFDYAIFQSFRFSGAY